MQQQQQDEDDDIPESSVKQILSQMADPAHTSNVSSYLYLYMALTWLTDRESTQGLDYNR